MTDDRIPPRAVSVEDLLRLKRAEQPSPQFWADFDRELRVKQLAAMVAKRPWWYAFPRASSFLSRQRLTLGAAAAAVAAVGLGAYGYRIAVPAVAVSSPGSLASAPAVASIAAPAPEIPAAAPRTVAMAIAVPARPSRPAAVASASVSDESAPSAIPVIDNVPEGEVAERFDASLSHPLMVDLGAAQSAGAELARNLADLPRGFGARLASESVPATEPLAQMPSPTEERRSRLMAEAYPAVDRTSDLSSPSDDRQLSRLSDDSLAESNASRRYDVAAERDMLYSNSIKFSIRF
jgi:hypothetical protein